MSFYRKNDNLPFGEKDRIDHAKSLREFAENKDTDFVQAHSMGGNPINKAARIITMSNHEQYEYEKIIDTICSQMEMAAGRKKA